MGISDLNVFLKKKTPDVFRRVSVSTFRGTRIAIDAQLWIFASFSAAYAGNVSSPHVISNDDLLKADADESVQLNTLTVGAVKRRVVSFVSTLYSNGITPIFVFDGTAVPEKSSVARLARQKRNDAIRTKIETIRARILGTSMLYRSDEDFVTLRSLMRQQPRVGKGVFAEIRHLIQHELLAPVCTAPDEAEKFCSFLTRKCIASAVFTTDTDTYALGATIVITGYSRGDGSIDETPTAPIDAHTFDVVCVPLILHRLGLTHAQFLDMCIMFGTDFNPRMPKIGPAKIFEMISAFLKEKKDTDDDLIKSLASKHVHLPWADLNTPRVREIFLRDEECEGVLKDLEVDVNMSNSGDVKDYNIRRLLTNLVPAKNVKLYQSA
jgi:flap endonuclease-1